MMRKKIITLSLGILLMSLASCGIDGHNTAPATDVNTDNTRIYGDIGQPARQLSFTYEPDGAVNKRANQIREKLYPKK